MHAPKMREPAYGAGYASGIVLKEGVFNVVSRKNHPSGEPEGLLVKLKAELPGKSESEGGDSGGPWYTKVRNGLLQKDMIFGVLSGTDLSNGREEIAAFEDNRWAALRFQYSGIPFEP